MKKFEVELRRTSWKVISVEAETEDEAVNLAYEKLSYDEFKSGVWDTESVWEAQEGEVK